MATRRAAWTAYGLAGIILLAAGFWSGKSVSPDAVTPDVLAGTVRFVTDTGDSFVIRLDGRRGVTTYPMSVSPITWRDKYGNWWNGTQPACLQPFSHGQHITFGAVNLKPAGGPAIGAGAGRSRVPVICASQVMQPVTGYTRGVMAQAGIPYAIPGLRHCVTALRNVGRWSMTA